ncbi:cell division protein FtsL [Pseudochrobactrum sp. MP213Fo]|uniref:cell division protein FtsL n=1 Tax=Pseudochrobactrum sp. MP213Fo TaxID=3022250 RepID=UPI003B9DEA22
MLRTIDIILIAVMLVAATVTYKIKHDAEKQVVEIRKIQRQIAFEKDTISLLRADWSLMTQPNRLQRLADVYKEQLKLEPVDVTQITLFDDIPMKQADDIEKLIGSTSDLVASVDPLSTGSIASGTSMQNASSNAAPMRIVIPGVRP